MGNNNDWHRAQTPDLSGRTVILTGANSGIGYHAAACLAERGAHVIMACRNLAKATEARDQLLKTSPNAELSLEELDLASLDSVRRFADRIATAYGDNSIDLLINNAGVMALPHRTTADGFEMQFGTNHLGHFALTNLILPLMRDQPGSRVVTVSSTAHRMGKMNFDDLQSERGYSAWGAYGQAKLANLLFTLELDRKLRAADSSIASTACHPGYASTNLQTTGYKMRGATFMENVMNFANTFVAQSAKDGALPTLRAATDPALQGGVYIGPGSMFRTRGTPVVETPSARARDVEDAATLWEISEELTATAFPLGDSDTDSSPTLH